MIFKIIEAVVGKTLIHEDGFGLLAPRRRLQRSEQYRTSSQTSFHLRRHWNGRPQTAHVFVGRSSDCAILEKHRYGTSDQAKKAFWDPTLKAEDAGAQTY